MCDSIRNTFKRFHHTLKIFFSEKPNKTLVLIEMMLPIFSYTSIHTSEAFGVKAGQKVSIAVINLNSDITTYIASEPIITATTPALVSLAESIASSQDLADKIAAFVGLSSHNTDDGSSSTSSTEDVTSTTTDNEASDEVSLESTASSSSNSMIASRHVTLLTSFLSWMAIGNLLLS